VKSANVIIITLSTQKPKHKTSIKSEKYTYRKEMREKKEKLYIEEKK